MAALTGGIILAIAAGIFLASMFFLLSAFALGTLAFIASADMGVWTVRRFLGAHHGRAPSRADYRAGVIVGLKELGIGVLLLAVTLGPVYGFRLHFQHRLDLALQRLDQRILLAHPSDRRSADR